MLIIPSSAAEETQPTGKSASPRYLLCLTPAVHCCNKPTSVCDAVFCTNSGSKKERQGREKGPTQLLLPCLRHWSLLAPGDCDHKQVF